MSKENKIDKVKNPFGNKYSIIAAISFINRLRSVRSCGYNTRIIKIIRCYNRHSYVYVLSDDVQGIRICLKKVK